MKLQLPDRTIEVFTVISRQEDLQEYFTDDIKPAVQLSDEYGFSGMLLFQSNRGNIEPWVFGQELLANSVSLSPIVAVNPVYMHPFTVAKKILTLCGFYGRKVYLNLITGTSKSDMVSLNDYLEHDKRYDRLIEYTKIIDALLRGDGPVTFDGTYYQVSNLQLSSKIREDILPDYFVAGSSEGAQKALIELNATKLGMAKPEGHLHNGEFQPPQKKSVHFGIVAREERDEAQAALKSIFPESKSNQEIQEYSMKNTDAVWKKEMQQYSNQTDNHTYSLVPFKNFKADCPYHVGSYEDVAEVIKGYVINGLSSMIIEIPPGEAEHWHISKVFKLAKDKLMSELYQAENNEFEFKF
ncbi:LLM class flavin-dependent oxidoreductase [Fulvivirga kasyanovii]|uniref:LLM class flavin-dependent oxidoreductase n=1 Tax=Fulvivirga kasyanovii TaxID=396812 RepID=UPI0031D31AAA